MLGSENLIGKAISNHLIVIHLAGFQNMSGFQPACDPQNLQELEAQLENAEMQASMAEETSARGWIAGNEIETKVL